jgi:hypothetical protein
VVAGAVGTRSRRSSRGSGGGVTVVSHAVLGTE